MSSAGLLLAALACSSKAAPRDAGVDMAGGVGSGGGPAGSGGSGGSNPSMAGTGGGVLDTDPSVLQRNKHLSRDGHFVQPLLTKAAAATMAQEGPFTATASLDSGATGADNRVFAAPLYLQNGPAGKGAFFLVTTGNDVYAMDETTGAKIWVHNVGSAPTSNGGTPTCGSIHPLGIISTPVIDPDTRTIHVAGAVGTNAIARHEVHALSVDDGSERSGWPVDSSGSSSGGILFDTVHQNQRGALSLVAGILYVPYGGHVGDCGGYHGFVIGIDVRNPVARGAWAAGGQGEGIWAAGGMASDGWGVFAATGNNTQGSMTHLDSEEVVRITGLGVRSDVFYPNNWLAMDQRDDDLGASNPLYLEMPGATPSRLVVMLSKDGHLFILDAAKLGGMGGNLVDLALTTGDGTIHAVPATYRTHQGHYVVFSVNDGATCPGGNGGRSMVAVKIEAGAPPAAHVAWCAPLGFPATGAIATTTDGRSEAMVWYVSGGNRLMGIDGDTGATIYDSAVDGSMCSGVRAWTSPIAVKGRIVVAGDGHVCAWSAPQSAGRAR
jgi:hypothetical protein